MGVASITILTRYLGPDDYGKYTLALLYMQLFGVLADVGLFTTVVRDISRQPERTEELVGNVLALRFVLSIVVILVGAGVSLLLPYDHDVRLAILLAGAPLLLGMLTTSLTSVLQARLRMGRAVTADVIGRTVALALAVTAVLLDLGFYAVIGAAAGGALASLVVAWLVTRPLVAIRPRADLAVWRGLLRVSIPLGLALAINQVYLRADTLIISISKPFEQVALYTLAYRILELTLVVGAVFVNSVLPVLSEAVVQDEPRARRVIRDSTDLMVVIGAPLAAGGLVLAPDIVRLAGGPDFAGAAAPLRLLLVSGAFILVNGIFGIALIAKDRQLSTLWLNVTALAFNVALNLVLVPKYGIVAAAAVTVASELLILLGSYVLMRRHLGYFPVPATLLPALAAAAAMAGLLALVAGAPLPLLVPAGAAVYCALLAAISPASRRLVGGLRA